MKVEVTSDGAGLVSHAGSALLAQVADKTGLTQALSSELAPLQLRAGSHDRGVVIRDLAVMLADGGDCLADLAAVRDQAALFGAAASDLTAFRAIDQIASSPSADRLAAGRACSRPRKVLQARRRPEEAHDRSRRDVADRAFGQGARAADLEARLRVSPDARLRR